MRWITCLTLALVMAMAVPGAAAEAPPPTQQVAGTVQHIHTKGASVLYAGCDRVTFPVNGRAWVPGVGTKTVWTYIVWVDWCWNQAGLVNHSVFNRSGQGYYGWDYLGAAGTVLGPPGWEGNPTIYRYGRLTGKFVSPCLPIIGCQYDFPWVSFTVKANSWFNIDCSCWH
jgi:hypothetical protein